MSRAPQPWSDGKETLSEKVVSDPGKKTVFVVADFKMAELFDMLAPYYLLNETGNANVMLVYRLPWRVV